MRTALPLLLIAFLYATDPVETAHASSLVDPAIATDAAVAPGAIIERDLYSRSWSVHPTAGYFTTSSTLDSSGSSATAHGYGVTGEALYSFSNHMGVNFSGMKFSGSGSCDVNGWLFGASVVLDPFEGNGFRLPFFFGLNYQHLASSTPSSPVITSMTLNSPGYTFGFSPRFNLWVFRVEPFLVATTPFKNGNVSCATNVVGPACGPIPVQTVPVVGINFVFRPWNLSFYFNESLSVVGGGASFYSLGPQLSF